MKGRTLTRLLALVCIIIFIMPNMAFADNAEALLNTDYNMEVSVVKALGYFDKEDMAAPVSGKEFKEAFEKMLDYDIKALYVGVDSVEQIKYAEAVKVFVDLLGYKSLAEFKGGYPVGYLSQAIEIKLTKNISIEAGEALSGNCFAKLIYNAMDIKVMQVEALKDDKEKLTTTKEKTFLTELLGLTRVKGRLTAAQGIGIYSNVDKAEAIIGGNKYLLSESLNILPMLGRYIEAYVNIETNELVCVTENKKYDVLTIKGEDVLSYKNHTICYVNENGKETEISLDKDVTIIKNGMPLTSYSAKDFIFTYGTLTFAEGKGGDYETVIINQYTDFVVAAIHPSDKTIYNQLRVDGAQESLNLAEENNKSVFITDSTGAKIDFSDIQVGDVLSVAKSSKVISIIRCQDRVNGFVVEGIETTDSETVIQSGEESIRISEFYSKYAKNISVSVLDCVNIYLNAFGDAAYLSYEQGEEYALAYLLHTSLEKGLSGSLRLKILTDTNSLTILECADTVTLENNNGGRTKYKSQLDLFNGLGAYKGIITYRADADGKVAEILIPLEEQPGVKRAENRLYHYTKEADEGYTYKAQIASLGNRLYIQDAYSKIFAISDATDDERHYVIARGELGADHSYQDAEMYTYGEDDVIVKAMVVNGFNDSFTRQDNYFVVSQISEAYSNGEAGKKVYGYQDGTAVAFFAADNERGVTALDEAVSKPNPDKKLKVEVGDIIRVNTGKRNGVVEKAEILYDRSEINPAFPNGQVGNLAQTIGKYDASVAHSNPWGMYETPNQVVYSGAKPIGAHGRVIYGWVLKKSGNYITITTQDLSTGVYEKGKDGFITEVHCLSYFSKGMTVFYPDEKKNIFVKGLSSDEIRDFESAGADCSRVIIRTNQGVPTSWYTLNNY